MKRKSISKKVRFEVFKRDSFTCQYCGKSAPDVLLEIDHIIPVASNGTNEIVNLITACTDCNNGKGAVALDDHSVAAKQMRQLKELNERREQIRLIAKWREEMVNLDEEQVNIVEARIRKLTSCGLSVRGRSEFKKSIRKYGIAAVLDALETSASQYLVAEDDESIEKFVSYTHRICYWNKEKEGKPEIERLSLVCSLAIKHWWRCNRPEVWRLANDAYYRHGVDIEEMIRLASSTTGIMQFREGLSELIEVSRG